MDINNYNTHGMEKMNNLRAELVGRTRNEKAVYELVTTNTLTHTKKQNSPKTKKHTRTKRSHCMHIEARSERNTLLKKSELPPTPPPRQAEPSGGHPTSSVVFSFGADCAGLASTTGLTKKRDTWRTWKVTNFSHSYSSTQIYFEEPQKNTISSLLTGDILLALSLC